MFKKEKGLSKYEIRSGQASWNEKSWFRCWLL